MSCPIYLINLPRDEQRLRVMQQQLDAMQLPFRRMDAVYGKDLSAAERASLYDEARNRRSYHQIMTPGEIGCYASHLRVWQDRAASPHAHALVLEDDVELLPQLPAVLAAMDELAPQWDMIKLVGRDHERSLRAWRLPPPAQASSLIRYRRPPSLTGAYLVSKEGAVKLLRTHQPFHRPIDVDLRHWWESGLRLYGLRPYPISLGEESFTSSIGQRAYGSWWARRWRKARGQWAYNFRNAWENLRLARQGDPFPELDPDRL